MRLLLLLLLLGVHMKALGQSNLSLRLNISPKLSVNHVTGINPSRGNSNYNSDHRYAVSGGWDVNMQIGYTLKKYNTFLAGFGFFQMNQNFRNDYILYGEYFRTIRKTTVFYHIPIDYERLIWENKHLHLYAGMGAGLIFEPFVTYTKSRDPYEEPVYHKKGQTVSGLKALYIPGMSLFSVIYSASASASYHLNKRLSFYSGIQLKQGLKQMIASICYFTQYDSNGDPLFYSFETGTASGQSIILNFGLNYTF